jgi:hypothetical protein
LTRISKEDVLIEVLAKQMGDDWLDDSAIEQEGDEHEP